MEYKDQEERVVEPEVGRENILKKKGRKRRGAKGYCRSVGSGAWEVDLAS